MLDFYTYERKKTASALPPLPNPKSPLSKFPRASPLEKNPIECMCRVNKFQFHSNKWFINFNKIQITIELMLSKFQFKFSMLSYR